MKKKIFALVAMVIVLSFVLAGCNLFVTNAQRDAHQVVATVEYKDDAAGIDITAEISKQEYAEFFSQNYSTYNYYYGFTAEECADMFINILAKQKMLVILASVDRANGDAAKVPELKFDEATGQYDYETYAKSMVSILGYDEQKYVKEQTNKIFEDEFESIISELAEKQKLIDDLENDKEEDDDKLKPRPQLPEKEEAPFKNDASVTIDDVNAVQDFFTANALDKDSTEYEKDAYGQIEESLETQYKSYYYYLAKQAESQLSTKYSEKNGDYEGELDAQTEYTTIIESETQLYSDSAAYKTAIEADAGDILVHNGQYIKVNSILLKFTEEQEALLATLNEKFASEKYSDYIIDLRMAMVFGDVEKLEGTLEEMPIPVQEELLGLTVNISNLDYKTGDDIDDAYDKTEVPFLEVIADMGRAIAAAEEAAIKEYKETYPNADINTSSYSAGQKMFITEKRLEEFEKWMYMVNDDEGMFQGTDYTETPLEQDSSYVSEYTALVRQLLMDQATAGASMVSVGEDATNVVSATEGGTETIIVEGEEVEVTRSATGDIVTTTAKLRGEEIVIYTDTTNEISFIINDFGVHIVMLTSVTVEEYNTGFVTSAENPDFDIDKYSNYTSAEIDSIKKANMIYTMTMDAFVGFDEETGKAITVREKIEKQLKETYDADLYNKFEKSIFDRYGDDLYDDSDDVASDEVSKFTFTRDDGLFKSMKKIYIQEEKEYLASQE